MSRVLQRFIPAHQVAEKLPGSDGKHQLTKAYTLFLARWARKLSWKETAEAFHTSGASVSRSTS